MRNLKRLSVFLAFLILIAAPITLAALPSTTNYQLNSYGFGSGGTANSGTSNYSLEGITGEISGQTASTATYQTKPGYTETQQANVPKVTITNPSNYYDKLKFVIDQQNNPTDAKYALQVSTSSNFSSGINYVKSDHTIGATLTLTDYQTYSLWGSGTGTTIIGLSANTTYYIRAKATQGQFTESAYGPSSNAATVGQQISFCTYSTSGSCGGSNSVSLGALVAGNISNSSTNIGVNFATNANSGGNVYIYSSHGALVSTVAPGSPITSATTANLGADPQGFGAQIASVSQSSGGPLNKVAPYDGSANSIGILSTNINTVLSASSSLVGGTAAIQLKAKPSATTAAAPDYAEVLTLIAAAAF
jgi:predicted secreted protein